MKTKLLKKLRKDCSWTCIQQDIGGAVIDKWMLLQRGAISEHPSSEWLIKCMLRYNSDYYNSIWDLRWYDILQQYNLKVSERKFRKYKQR
jgi:hypothetical protein